MKKFIISCLVILGYLLLLIAINILHNNIFSVNVVFYSALFDVFLASILLAVILRRFSISKILSKYEFNLLLLVCILSGYIYAISVPTVIDRSLSFYLLEKINQQGGRIKFDSLSDLIANDYVKEHRIVDVRVTEQLESGTIKLEKGCIYLLDKGKFLVATSEFIRKYMLPSKRLLLNEYSSDLKEPLGAAERIRYDRDCN